MPLDPRTPVLVGAGVAQQRFDDPGAALEAVELMAVASDRAGTDAHAPALLRDARMILVPRGTWRYRDPGRLLAARFGAVGAHGGRRRRGVAADAVHRALRGDRRR